ncbi:Flp pilus assembly protein CpaB [Parerythrobacter aurantius]|uniref:Flp pilus assembly protein CpaB n=1 Tax=Parerythrobacter aurantius TaxID=3127706 RepID=UPI00324F0116
MDRKKLVLLLAALIIAVGTALAARSMFAGASAPQAEAAAAEVQGPMVLVAQRSLPVGTIITADALGFQKWPKELVKDAYFIEGESDIGKLLGTVVRNPVTAGEPVTQGSLVKPGDRGFLAAALGPGMRAITVPVSANTAVAGFVFPGDRVDLMLTQAVKGEGEGLKATETILRNLRVLATDQQTEQLTGEDGKTIVRGFSTVTLEVTPKIAEKVAVAQTLGTLSLSLRSIADNQAELERAIASGAVKIPDGASPEEEERLLQAALNAPNDGPTSYSTGGDVSRFQSSVLRKPATDKTQAAAAAFVETIKKSGGAEAGTQTVIRPVPTVRVSRGKSTSEEPIGATGRVLTGEQR